jgi:hypothetical protein
MKKAGVGYLMNQRKIHPQRIGNFSSPLRSTGIRRNHNSILVIWYSRHDVSHEEWSTEEIVYGYIEETLELGVLNVNAFPMGGGGKGCLHVNPW